MATLSLIPWRSTKPGVQVAELAASVRAKLARAAGAVSRDEANATLGEALAETLAACSNVSPTCEKAHGELTRNLIMNAIFRSANQNGVSESLVVVRGSRVERPAGAERRRRSRARSGWSRRRA